MLIAANGALGAIHKLSQFIITYVLIVLRSSQIILGASVILRMQGLTTILRALRRTVDMLQSIPAGQSSEEKGLLADRPSVKPITATMPSTSLFFHFTNTFA